MPFDPGYGLSGGFGGPYTVLLGQPFTVGPNTLLGQLLNSVLNITYLMNMPANIVSTDVRVAWNGFNFANVLGAVSATCGNPGDPGGVAPGAFLGPPHDNGGFTITMNPGNYVDAFGTQSYVAGVITYPSIVDYRAFSSGTFACPIQLSAFFSICGGPSEPRPPATAGSSLIITLPENIVIGGAAAPFWLQNLLTACGAGPLVYSVKAGALPTGVTLNANGTTRGLPTVSQLFDVTIQAEAYAMASYCYGTLRQSGVINVNGNGTVTTFLFGGGGGGPSSFGAAGFPLDVTTITAPGNSGGSGCAPSNTAAADSGGTPGCSVK